jgi:hypothetical protein
MVSFTALVNRAHRRFVDKYLTRREFGVCDACGRRTLLVKLIQKDGSVAITWDLCEGCYDKTVDEEIN